MLLELAQSHKLMGKNCRMKKSFYLKEKKKKKHSRTMTSNIILKIVAFFDFLAD